MSKNRVTVVCERGAWHAGHKPRALAVFERESVPERMDCAGWRAVQVQGKDRESDQARLYPVVGINPVKETYEESFESARGFLWPQHADPIEEVVARGGDGLTERKIAEARLQTRMDALGVLLPCEHVLGRQVFEDEEDRADLQPCMEMLAVCPCGWPSSVVTLCDIVDKLEEAARGTGVIHIEDIATGGAPLYVHNRDFDRQLKEWRRKERTRSRALGEKVIPAFEFVPYEQPYTYARHPFVIMCDGNNATANYHCKHGAHVLAVIPMPSSEEDAEATRGNYNLEASLVGREYAWGFDWGDDVQGLTAINEFELAFDTCPCCRTDLPAFEGLRLWDACKPLYDQGARFVNVNTVLTIWQRMG